jgi:hypothetical protein
MSNHQQPFVAEFRPLAPAAKRRLILGAVVGPIIWLVALVVGAVTLRRGSAIEIGLLVAGASLVVALIVLRLLLAGRRREERRYAGRG